MCDNNIKMPHILYIPDFFRSYQKHRFDFCSEKCAELFKNENCCHICCYDKNLRNYVDKNGNVFKLCTVYPGNFSCYDKYLKYEEENKIDFSETMCSFCKNYSTNNLPWFGVHRCKLCFNKITFIDFCKHCYKNTTDTEDDDINEKSHSSLITHDDK